MPPSLPTKPRFAGRSGLAITAIAPAGAALLVIGLVTGCASANSTSSESSSPADSQTAFVSAIDRVLPSVVEIRTPAGLGSGVVFDSGGDIVTNAHVVGAGKDLQVLLPTSAEPLPASLVGIYRPDDLAVIKVGDAKDLRPAAFGDSAKLVAGDMVLAIGNPLGLAGSVTEGIVSAVGRIVSEPAAQGSPGATLPDTIQTSAAINPGNSGGALVTLNGQVIGIPTLAVAGNGAQGIGFAISSNIATSIAQQLVKTGHVTDPHRAALGVTAATIVGGDGKPAGVRVVAATTGSGLAADDVITAVDGTATLDIQALATVLAALSPGQSVAVQVTHPDGSTASVQVTLGQLPDS